MPYHLDEVLGQRSKLSALRTLFSDGGELTGREIGRRAGLSHLAAHKALSALAAQGIVERRSVPPTYLFRQNREHWICSAILGPMFSAEAAWVERLEGLLILEVPPSVVSLVLFGSIVKGALAPRSDVDLLALVRGRRDVGVVQDHFDAVAERVHRSFGRPLSTVVMPAAELAARHVRKEEFAKEVAYSGRVIRGKLLTEVLFENGAQEHRR